MTPPPDSPFESTSEDDKLAHEIRDALQQSTVEFRVEAQESAIAAALAEHHLADDPSGVAQPLSTSTYRPWLLVAASIVVVCIGLGAAVLTLNGGSSTMMAAQNDSATEATVTAEAADDSAQMYDSFDSEGVEDFGGNAPAEAFENDELSSADGATSSPEVGRNHDETLANLPSGSFTYLVPAQSFASKLVEATQALQGGPETDAVGVVDFGIYTDQVAFSQHLDDTVAVEIVPGVGERSLQRDELACLQSHLIDSLVLETAFIGITIIDGINFSVSLYQGTDQQVWIVASPTNCSL